MSTAPPSRRPPRPIVFLVAGAPQSGKTRFLQRLTKANPLEAHPSHLPYIITNKNRNSMGRSPELHFYEDKLPWSDAVDDFAVGEERGYQTLDADYDGSPDVIVLCFDIGSRSSIDSVPHLANDITMMYPSNDIPILLLGLKRDLRSTTSVPAEENLSFVLPKEGYGMAQALGLARYMECSCVTGELEKEVAEDVVGEGIKRRMNMQIDKMEQAESGGCTIC